MRFRTLTTLAATAAVALAGVAATASCALADSPPAYDYAVLQIRTHSGFALDVAGASKGDGTPVIQWTPNFQDNQRWRFVPINGHHQIRSVNSNKCLTASALSGPSLVVQWVCNPSRLNQQWDVEPGSFSSDVLNDLTIRSAASGLPLTASTESSVPGRQLSVKNSLLGDDPGQIFDFTTSVR
ncbi:MAG: RICIN domain-containing protein [Gemmatimonadaceae bacterium]